MDLWTKPLWRKGNEQDGGLQSWFKECNKWKKISQELIVRLMSRLTNLYCSFFA